jgi:hypothetical protein
MSYVNKELLKVINLFLLPKLAHDPVPAELSEPYLYLIRPPTPASLQFSQFESWLILKVKLKV